MPKKTREVESVAPYLKRVQNILLTFIEEIIPLAIFRRFHNFQFSYRSIPILHSVPNFFHIQSLPIVDPVQVLSN